MVSPEQYRKAVWHSRRGMLELDELLVPFVKEAFPQLSEREKHIYIQFIKHEDTDLFHWMIEHGQPPQLEFQSMIQAIKAHAALCR